MIIKENNLQCKRKSVFSVKAYGLKSGEGGEGVINEGNFTSLIEEAHFRGVGLF